MRPIRIVAKLVEPVAGPAAPQLDALLEWCMSRHVGKDFGLSHNTAGHRAAYQPGLIPIPLARRTLEGYPHPIALCSSAVLADVRRDGVEYYAKRIDLSEPDLVGPDGQRVVVTNAGEFKGYRLPLRVRMVDRIAWFAVGDRKEVRRLLRDVYALGKKTSQGFGRVASWSIEDAAQDWSWFAPTEAGPILMRNLPATADLPADCWGYRQSFGSPCPPYWLAELRTEVFEPC